MLKPGYKQTDIGVLPEEITLGNLFLDKPDKTLASGPNETVSFIGMEDVSDKGEIIEAHQLPKNQIKKGLTYFEKDDVLVAKITPCFENGKGAHLDKLGTKAGFGSTEFHVLRAKSTADARYIFYHTQTPEFRLKLAGEMVGSAGHRRVPLSAIRNYPLPFSHSYEEQQAIADTLGAVDALLREQRALLAKKRDLKLATQTALLTRARRLPGFSGEWQERTLGDVVKIKKGRMITEKMRVRGNVPVIAGGQAPAYYHNQANREGPVITVSASGAYAGYVAFHNYPIFASDCSTIEEGANYDLRFIYFFLKDKQREIYEAQTGGAQPHIHAKDVEPFQLFLPKISEQKAIADTLGTMDTELAALTAHLAKTEALKQGLMQDLLTGTIRLRGAAPLSPTL